MSPIDPILANQIVRREWSRIVASAMRILGDLDLAEDAAQESLAAAIEHWPIHGVPTHPGAWLTTVCRRRALNMLRAKRRRMEVSLPLDVAAASEGHAMADDRLTLLLLCCHRALSREAQVALTLRLGGGLSTREIARALLVDERALGQRISRAKRRLREIAAPFASPSPEEIAARLDVVLEVVYLVFNEGYFSQSQDAIRSELVGDAAMLAEQLCELAPERSEVWGLASMIHFKAARTASRLSADGALVPLDEQSRSTWKRDYITRGERYRASAIGAARAQNCGVGRYVLQAEIEAHHCRAERFEDTNWEAIDQLYEALVTSTNNPVAELAWVVARSYARSPSAGMALLDHLGTESKLAQSPTVRATRADLLRRMSHPAEAGAIYRVLSRLQVGAAERRFYERRAAECAETEV